MTRAVIPECPPVLDIDIDVNKKKQHIYQAIYRLGRNFTWNPFKVRRAAWAAWHAHLNYQELMSREGLTPPQAIARLYEKPPGEAISKEYRISIGLIGHPYLLYDEHVNHRLLQRLQKADCRIVTPEMLTPHDMLEATQRIVGKALWTYEEEIIGSGGHYLARGMDGVIGVVAFGCGPDSLIMDMVKREADKLKTGSFMSLTLEEHTAETGVVTRLEAFLDMIARRKRRREAGLCA